VLPATTLTESCYYSMFQGCSQLFRAPALPATELKENCYYSMFYACSSLKAAPALPAMELASRCYHSMFEYCDRLTSVPELPATTLAPYCYQSMFWGCFDLTSVPLNMLPATTLTNTCYNSMFRGCTSLTSAPVLPATTLATSCYSQMFKGCTSLTSAPELPATTLANYCYSEMFSGCTSLTSIFDNLLPATTLANYCYREMFYGCTGLTSTPTLPATTLANYCYSEMFCGCTGLTSAPALPATTLTDYCYEKMFKGCTHLTSVPALSVETLAKYCCCQMFQGCTGLTSAPALPAMTLANYCYGNMFQDCTGLMSAPELPATTLATGCYREMFCGCTSLTTAPALPATTLANYCYGNMFQDCTGLMSAPELPATTLATGCYGSMFCGCTSLTTAPALPAMTLANYCYGNMFQGCIGLTSAPVLPATTLATSSYKEMFRECTNLSSVTCYATARDNTNATMDWLNGVAVAGTFYGPKNSVFASQERNASNIPEGWTLIPFRASLITAPTAKSGLVYIGTAQALLNNDGVAEGGTLKYSLDNSTWSASVPAVKNAGDYTVYYMVEGDDSHADFIPSPNTVDASIAKTPLTIKADDRTLEYGDPAWWCYQASYSGFVNGEDAAVLSGAVQFDCAYTDGGNAGTYSITPYGTTSDNYAISFVAGIITVNKVASVVTIAPAAVEGLVANGSLQTLVTAGTVTGGELQYKLNDGAWNITLPQAAAADTYTVWYKVVGDVNHNDIAATSLVVTIAAPAQNAVNITANQDPQHAGVYYSTFYDSSVRFALPAGVEAYVAAISGDDLLLTKIAQGGQIIPADNAVILKSGVQNYTLTPSDEAPVSFSVVNNLQGTDVAINTPSNCYVLSGQDGKVGFYQYSGNTLNAHKAYVIYTGGGSGIAPRRMYFVFNEEQTATRVESQKSNVESQESETASRKVIENGQLVIIRDGMRYNAQGQVVR